MNMQLSRYIALLTVIVFGGWGMPHAFAQDEAGDMPQADTSTEVDQAEPADAVDAMEANEQVEADEDKLVTRVQSVKRNALWRTDAEADWQTVEAGEVLPIGAELRTSVGSEVLLAAGPNVDLTVGPLSRFVVGRLERDGEAIRTRVAVPMGNVDYEVKDVGFENDLAITTPSGTMAVKGTEGNLTQYDQTDIDNDEGNVTFLTPYNMTVFIDGNGNLFGGLGNRGSGAGGNDTENDNQGDGNNNDTGNPLPNRDTLDGNNSQRNTKRQFERDLVENGGGGQGGSNGNGGGNGGGGGQSGGGGGGQGGNF